MVQCCCPRSKLYGCPLYHCSYHANLRVPAAHKQASTLPAPAPWPVQRGVAPPPAPFIMEPSAEGKLAPLRRQKARARGQWPNPPKSGGRLKQWNGAAAAVLIPRLLRRLNKANAVVRWEGGVRARSSWPRAAHCSVKPHAVRAHRQHRLVSVRFVRLAAGHVSGVGRGPLGTRPRGWGA